MTRLVQDVLFRGASGIRYTGDFSSVRIRRFFSSHLVTPRELCDALGRNASSKNEKPRVVPLCASWFLPNDVEGRTGLQAFRKQRIPRARFFDLDKVVDRHSPYPHMLPNAKDFAAAMSELGIRREDTVVVYDSAELGIFSAPRVGWTLRIFGHPKVHILNNFRLWLDEGLPTETGEVYSVDCCPYPIPEMDATRVASHGEVREAVLDQYKEGMNAVVVIDARSNGRFTGQDPEPRLELSSGHMPGAINIPFDAVLDPETKAFLSPVKIAEVFSEKGIDADHAIILSCGTGVTACVLETALYATRYSVARSIRVYDGSWTEWVQRVDASKSLICKNDNYRVEPDF